MSLNIYMNFLGDRIITIFVVFFLDLVSFFFSQADREECETCEHHCVLQWMCMADFTVVL